MNYAEHPERERTLNQALRARTLSQIAVATRELDRWVDDHPDDWGIRDAYEVLENMREIAEQTPPTVVAERRLAETVG